MTSIKAMKTTLSTRHARGRSLAITAGSLTLAILVGYGIHAARASGIPSVGALVYSGVLTKANGDPLASPQDIEIGIWDDKSAGTQRCVNSFPATTLDTNGRFQVTMPDKCATEVTATPDLWVEVKVGTTILGRSKIGAVPYAIAANDSKLLGGSPASDFQKRVTTGCAANSSIRAIDADGKVTCEADDDTAYTGATGLVPTGMIGMFATTCPTGWSLCDGTGGRPNLVGAYVKGGSAFAAQTGANTHSHKAGTYATSTDGAHTHTVHLTWDNNIMYGDYNSGAVPWTATDRINGTWTGATSSQANISNGIWTSSNGSHSHTLSGSSEAVSHEPVHATLVFCVKN